MISRNQFFRQEHLVDHLIKLLEKPIGVSWLEPHHVIVPSMDYAHWLKTLIGRRSEQRIAANIEFYQPAEFIEQWSRELLGVSAEHPEWNRENLQWALFRLLSRLQEESELEGLPQVDDRVRRKSLKQFRLAGHLSDVYDKYMIYRPDWLNRWRTDPSSMPDQFPGTSSWQAHLWHRLCRKHPKFEDRAELIRKACEKMDKSSSLSFFPDRIFILNLASLPNPSVAWLGALREVERPQVYSLEWRPIEDREEEGERSDESETLSSLQKRSRLLCQQWNGQRNEFGSLMRRYWTTEVQSPDGVQSFGSDSHAVQTSEKTSSEEKKGAGQTSLFPGDSDPSSNLNQLQTILRNPSEKGDISFDSAEQPASLQIHSAHGPLREVEVLYERLLACMDRDSTLQPDDILIVSPDMDTYAPHINAVFGEPGDEELHIPYQPFKGGRQSRYRLTELLVELLRTARGRVKVTELLDLISQPPIRQSLRLTLNDVQRLEEWFLELQVRWGYDAFHRGRVLKQSAAPRASIRQQEQNSWQWAMDRLWLGLSTRSAEEQRVHGRLPFGAVEGSEDGRRVGGLQRLIRQLWQLNKFMESDHTLSEWKRWLSGLIREWFGVEREQEPALQWLLEQVEGLDAFEEQAESADPVEVSDEILLDHLEQQMLRQRHPVTRIAGRAVVAPMIPMRGIPFRVVAMVGLNQDSFPDADPTNPFDVTPDDPRKGDRSRRREDRQLMMDYLMSVRQTLLITYSGRDQRDDETLPPSPLVTELLDLLTDDDDGKHTEWITPHPLHGFEARNESAATYLESRRAQSKRAFEEDRQEDAMLAPVVGLNHPIEKLNLDSQQQPIPITLQELIRFYGHPIKYYCERRLGIRLREEEQVDTDEEPFELDPLTRYRVYNRILSDMLEHPGEQPDPQFYREQGLLPHGFIGSAVWEDVQEELKQQRDKIFDYLENDEVQDPLEMNMELDIADIPIHLRAESSLIAGPCQLVTKTGGSVKPKDRLRTWIYHLGCNAYGEPKETLLWGKFPNSHKPFKLQEHFESLDQPTATEHLRTLVRGYLIGIRRPLAFLPESSYGWAATYFDGESDENESSRSDEALQAAADKFYDEHAYKAYENERHDDYNRYFFHEVNPYKPGDSDIEPNQTERLIESARRIWKPYWEARYE